LLKKQLYSKHLEYQKKRGTKLIIFSKKWFTDVGLLWNGPMPG